MPADDDHPHVHPHDDGHSHGHSDGHGHSHDHSVDHHDPAPAEGRPLRIGIGGPVGSGKTALVASLCRAFADELGLAVVTNDIYTTEDADHLRRVGVIDGRRIVAVETGCCPHTAIRDDISANLDALERLEQELGHVAALADRVRRRQPHRHLRRRAWSTARSSCSTPPAATTCPARAVRACAQADLLVINKVDLAPYVGSDVERMVSDATARRDGKPVATTALRTPDGIAAVADWVEAEVAAWAAAVRGEVVSP